jgi:hypothetical protein
MWAIAAAPGEGYVAAPYTHMQIIKEDEIAEPQN